MVYWFDHSSSIACHVSFSTLIVNFYSPHYITEGVKFVHSQLFLSPFGFAPCWKFNIQVSTCRLAASTHLFPSSAYILPSLASLLLSTPQIIRLEYLKNSTTFSSISGAVTMLNSHPSSRLAPITGTSSGAWTITHLGDKQVLNGYGLRFVRYPLSLYLLHPRSH